MGVGRPGDEQHTSLQLMICEGLGARGWKVNEENKRRSIERQYFRSVFEEFKRTHPHVTERFLAEQARQVANDRYLEAKTMLKKEPTWRFAGMEADLFAWNEAKRLAFYVEVKSRGGDGGAWFPELEQWRLAWMYGREAGVRTLFVYRREETCPIVAVWASDHHPAEFCREWYYNAKSDREDCEAAAQFMGFPGYQTKEARGSGDPYGVIEQSVWVQWPSPWDLIDEWENGKSVKSSVLSLAAAGGGGEVVTVAGEVDPFADPFGD